MRKVIVFGGANIDIIGRSDSKLISFDSNIGKVIQTFGGVGRNIAENIVRYGINVHFVSVLGNDINGHNCIQYCQDLGMNMDDCMIVEGENTSTYLAVLDNKGDMHIAINDMDILRYMSIDHISKVLSKVNKEDLIVLDTNLDQEVMDFIFDRAICPIYVDPISCNKCVKIKNKLNKIHVLKPNIYEASALTNIEYHGLNSVKEMGKHLIEQGVHEVYISLGGEGSMYFTKKDCIHVKSNIVEVVNATGAGDAFMGAIVASDVLNYDLERKLKFASSASICTIETGASVCRNLSVETVNSRMSQLHFEIKEN